jgi:hypothetical protein
MKAFENGKPRIFTTEELNALMVSLPVLLDGKTVVLDSSKFRSDRESCRFPYSLRPIGPFGAAINGVDVELLGSYWVHVVGQHDSIVAEIKRLSGYEFSGGFNNVLDVLYKRADSSIVFTSTLFPPVDYRDSEDVRLDLLSQKHKFYMFGCKGQRKILSAIRRNIVDTDD